MRYDDASQAGSMANDSAPVARPDVDTLAPGNFGPAAGNVITGAGTVTGSSGADTVGDAPGHIVEVRGAGGATSGSGGNFQATGQYGVLNMDAEGNFSYVRNAGTPDGVQDVFGYTLADADGQTSATTLAIDISKVGAAQAAVAIPGVVNLPPGVQLSDIRVSGRDLIINMPDGTQMVIPGGAVFVPQLVIGDVQVPASNLAALLVESEPQPAAGQLSSSGGNFATDVPPLDPGVPLGDLIPPTEFGFPLPIFEEVGGFIDREPEAGAASVQLDDDDVPGKNGNAGGTGDDVGSPNATASGSLPGSGGDGTLEWDLLTTGAPSGFTYVDGPNGSVLVQQVQNGSTVTVLTITIDPATGAFTVTENNPILHATGDNENNAVFVINYTVTDDDGDVAPGTLTINVDDDTPVVQVNAGPDANVLLTTDDSQSIPGDGNPDTAVTTANFSGVFTGTSVSPGADGAGPGTSSTYALAVTGSSSGLTSHGVAINLFVVNGVVIGTTATSAGGINAGNTIFTVETTNTGIVTLTQYQQIDHPIAQDPTPTGAPFIDQIISMADGLVTLTRSETVVDRDGDSVTGSATVNIGANLRFTDDGPAISLADRGEPTLEVDETNLGTNDTESFAANFSADFGADGPAAAGGGITYALGINAGATGLIDTLTGQAVVLSVVGGQVVGTAGAGGPTVFVVSVDASGNVTLDQQRAVMHTPDSGPDQPTTLAADNLVTLTATATDFDGDTASQTLNIGLNLIFRDDAPSLSGNSVTGTVDEDGVPAGIPGGPGDVAGEATVATGSVSTLFNSGADQPLTFSLLTDTSGLPALTSNGVAVTYQVVGNTLTASAGGNTVFTFVLNSNGSYTFTLVDQLDHPTLNGQAGDNTENDLTIALGSIIRATDADGDFVDANANGLVITVDDDTPTASGNQVTGTVDEDGVPGGIAGGPGDVAGESAVAVGSVSTLFNSGADQPLSFSLLTGTSGLPALTSNGVTVTYQVVGNTLTASAGGNTVFTFVLNANGSWTFTLLDQLDHPTLNGQAGDNTENDLSIDLSSIIQATDADGDSVTANANGLVITVDDDTPTNNANVVTLQVDEDAIAGGNPGGPNDGPGSLASDSGSISGLFNSGADQPLTLSMATDTSGLPALTSNGVAVTYQVVGNTLTASAGGNTVFTLVLNPATGNVTFTLVDQLDHPTLNGQAGDNTENNLILDFSSMFQGTDADGDSISLDAGSFLVDVDDDTPITTANTSTGTVDEDGVPGGIAGGPGDVAGTATVANGSVTTLFSAGADAPLSFSLSTSTGGLPALTSGGLQVTYAVVGNTLTASAGGNTVFTFVLNANGTWTFTLVDQLDHPTLNGQVGDDTENDLTIDLSSVVVATDADGDSITAAANGLVITVDDDTPVAANDTDTVGAIGTTATGNVITDAAPGDAGDGDTGADSVGADQPGTIIALASVGNPGATDTDPSPGIFSIQGQFGVLVMDTAGNYTYTRTGGPGGAVDVFTYTLQDADGDKVTATLTITAADTAPVATTAAAKVDDEGLSGGIVGGPGDENQNTGESPITASEATWSGLLGGSGGDAPVQFLFSTSLTGTTASVGQETVTYTVSGAAPAGFGTTLTATITGGARNGTVLFTVTITDTATGAYTVQLLDNVLHPTLNGLAGDNTENNVSVNINYQMRDADGDTSAAPGVLSIDFDDDSPTATVVTTGQTVSLDESAGNQVDSNDVTGPLAAFAGVSNPGDDPDVAGTVIQYATNASALVASTGTAFGADGAAASGSIVFSLNVSVAGVDSGLNVTGGQDILLFKEGDLIVGRVSGGAFNGQAAFAISIDPTTGAISMVEYLSIQHNLNGLDPDDSVSITNGAILAFVTATDADGDSTTSTGTPIGSLLSFQDSAPIMTAASNINIQNSGDFAANGTFAYDLGADGPRTDNDVIKSVTFSAVVNGVTVQTTTPLTQVSEDAHTATFSFSFTYNTGGSSTATETGTITFYKDNFNAGSGHPAGTYTVDLDSAIVGITINQTGGLPDGAFTGYVPGTSTVDSTQPEVSVAAIASDLFVQFTGKQEPPGGDGNHTTSVGGDSVFTNGELFVNDGSWVSTSGSAAGVAGDTMQSDEILDFNLYATNPTGNLGQTPTQSASNMFLKFDGIGSSEDMIIILKLWSDTNGNGTIDAVGDTFTTKAIMVENGDIFKGPGSGPGLYSSISLDQNDGLVIIESNDYNGVGETWQIVGAQIVTDPTNVTGTAINLNPAIGPTGDSDADNNGSLDTQPFSTDINDSPMKISSIGFVRPSTTAQNAEMTFNVTVQDGDNDPITQTVTATVTSSADSSTPISLSPSVTTISMTPLTTKSTAAVSDTLQPATNSNNVLVGALAAAGLAASDPLAASDLHDFSSVSSGLDGSYAFSNQSFSPMALDSGVSHIALSSLLGQMDVQGMLGDLATQRALASEDFQAATGLDHANAAQDAPVMAQLLQGTDGPIAHVGGGAGMATASAITMPGLDQLLAGGLANGAPSIDGAAQHNAVVGQVLADALNGGSAGPNVEALINAIGGEHSVMDVLASHAAGAVPNGDMGIFAGFTGPHEMIMDQMVMHVDAPAQV